MTNVKKLGQIKKLDANIKCAEKTFEQIGISAHQIMFEEERNSIQSNNIGTSSLGNNDQHFEDVMNCISNI